MNLKIIQKMLAIVIATSTIMSTPGLASALPPKKKFLQNKTKRPKDEGEKNEDFKETTNTQSECIAGWENQDEEKFEPEAKPVEKDSDSELFEVQSLVKQLSDILEKKSQVNGNDIEKIIENLTKKENLFGQEKKIFETLFNILNNSLIQNSNAGCFIKLFSKHVGNPDVKNIVFDCFCRISFEFQFDQTNFEDIFRILSECSNDDHAKKCGAYIINNLYSRGFLDSYTKDQALKIVDIMFNYLNQNDAKQNIVDLIVHFAQKGFFFKYPKEKISKLIYVMIACANDENAGAKVSDAIGLLFKHGAFEESSEEQILKIIDILNDLSKKSIVKGNVAAIVQDLTRHLDAKNCARKYMLSMVNILNNCSNDTCAKTTVASSINFLTKSDFINVCSKKEILPMTNILNTCCENVNVNARKHILDSILTLSDKNLLKGYSKEEAASVIKTLFKYVNDDEVAKKYGLSILKLIYQWISKNWTEHDRAKIMNVYNEYIKDNEIKKQFLDFVENSLEKDFVDDLSSNQMVIVFDLLNKCSFNGETQKNVAQVIFKLESKGFLQKFLPRENIQIINMLNRCVDNNDLTKISESDEIYIKKLTCSVINSMISKCHLNSISEEEISVVLETLDKCAEVKEIKNNVLNSIINEILNDIFKNSQKDNFIKILNILDKCGDDENSKANISKIIFLLFEKGVFKENFQDQIIKILDILTGCLDCGQAREEIIFYVSKLLRKVFLSNYKSEEFGKILQILNKCADDDGLKGKISQMINYLSENSLKNMQKEEIHQMLDIISKCANSDETKSQVVQNLSIFLSCCRQLNKLGKEEIIKIFHILDDYCYDYCYKDQLITLVKWLTARSALTDFSRDETMLILNVFNKNLKYENVRKEFPSSLFILILKNCCKNCSKEDVDTLLNLLRQCCTDDVQKLYVDVADNLLNNRDFSTIHSEENKKLIIDMIEKYASDKDLNGKFILDLIKCLSVSYYINNYSEEDLIKIICILDKFADNNYIQSAATKITVELIAYYRCKNCPKEKFKFPIDILCKYADKNLSQANEGIVYGVLNIIVYYIKIGCFNEEFQPLLEILDKYAKNNSNNDEVAKMLSNCIVNDFQKYCSKENMLKIFDLLYKCIDKNTAKKSVLVAAASLIYTGYFAGDQKGMLKAINLWNACFADNDDIKFKTFKNIFWLTTVHRFKFCSEAVSEALVDMLNKYIFDTKMAKYILCDLAKLAKEDGLVNYPKEKVSKIINMMSILIENSKLPQSELTEDDVAQKVLDITLFLLNNGFLKEFPMEQIRYMLSKCCSSDSTKKYLVVANYFLTNSSKLTTLELIEILNKCLDEDDKNFSVSYIILNIINFNQFKSFSEEELKALINILNRCNNKPSMQIEVVQSVWRLITSGSVDNYLKSEKKLLTEIIYKGFESDSYNVRYYLISIIGALLSRNFFENNIAEIKPIIDFMFKCVNINEFKANTSILVRKLITNKFLINYSKVPIICVLDECVNRNQDNKYISIIIKSLSDEKVAGDLSNIDISKLLGILEKCSEGKFEDADSIKYFLIAINCLILKKAWSSGNISKYNSFKVIKLLDFCMNHKNVNGQMDFLKSDIAIYVARLISKRLKHGLCGDEFEKMINLLIRCFDDNNAKKYVVIAFYALTRGECGDEFIKNTETLLQKDSDNKIKNNIMIIIYLMIKYNLSYKYDKIQISNILKIMNLCATCETLRPYIREIGFLLIANGFLKDCSKDDVLQALNFLTICPDMDPVLDNIAIIIFKLNACGLLKDSSEEEMSLLMGMLSESFRNGKIKTEILKIFDILFTNDCLKYGIRKTTDILEKMDENDQDRKNVINIIEKLSDNKCLNNATQDEMERITDILIKNLENNQLKLDSLKCIQKLLVNNQLHNLQKDKTKNIINALNYTHGDCELNKFSANILVLLAWHDCIIGWSKDEILSIMDILYRCSDDPDATQNVAQAFAALANKKCFSEFSVDETRKIVEVLDKFAINTPAKPFVAKAVEQLVINDCFKKYSKNEISKIINIIGQCCNEENSRKFSASAIKQLANHGLIEQAYGNILKTWWNIPIEP